MGYQATVQDDNTNADLIPEDTILTAKLLSIAPKDIAWTKDGERKTATLLNWKFEITSNGEYQGKWVWGSTPSVMSMNANNRFRNWSEVLLGRPFAVGEALDTDDLLGLTADVMIGHRPDKKDPEKKYQEVSDLLPADGDAFGSEPPF